jgi:hypothetical protein
MVIEADAAGLRAYHREAVFDVSAVVADLHARGYPNASFLESVLEGGRF